MIFRKKPKPDAVPSPAETYAGLRTMALQQQPMPRADGPTWGFVMDLGVERGTATLVCFCDGTTSLYTTSGFGVIGAGAHPQVVAANAALLRTTDAHLDHLPPSTDTTLPAAGEAILRALVPDGQRVFRGPERDFADQHHPLAAVFYAAQAVLTEVRLIADRP